jgi:hypothetical protein
VWWSSSLAPENNVLTLMTNPSELRASGRTRTMLLIAAIGPVSEERSP